MPRRASVKPSKGVLIPVAVAIGLLAAFLFLTRSKPATASNAAPDTGAAGFPMDSGSGPGGAGGGGGGVQPQPSSTDPFASYAGFQGFDLSGLAGLFASSQQNFSSSDGGSPWYQITPGGTLYSGGFTPGSHGTLAAPSAGGGYLSGPAQISPSGLVSTGYTEVNPVTGVGYSDAHPSSYAGPILSGGKVLAT